MGLDLQDQFCCLQRFCGTGPSGPVLLLTAVPCSVGLDLQDRFCGTGPSGPVLLFTAVLWDRTFRPGPDTDPSAQCGAAALFQLQVGGQAGPDDEGRVVAPPQLGTAPEDEVDDEELDTCVHT